MPVRHGLYGLRVLRLTLEMDKGNGQPRFSRAPMFRQDKHLLHAVVLWRHANDIDRVSDGQWRCRSHSAAPCLEREDKLFFEVVVPTHRTLGLAVRVDDDLREDAIFAFRLF